MTRSGEISLDLVEFLARSGEISPDLVEFLARSGEISPYLVDIWAIFGENSKDLTDFHHFLPDFLYFPDLDSDRTRPPLVDVLTCPNRLLRRSAVG